MTYFIKICAIAAVISGPSFGEQIDLNIQAIPSSEILNTIPHDILGLSLGQTSLEAKSIIIAEFEDDVKETTSDVRHIRDNGDDVSFSFLSRFTYKSQRSSDGSADQLAVYLGTDALEGRVVGISRKLILGQGNTVQDIVKSLKEKYGNPSLEHEAMYRFTLHYAYGEGGFISDLQQVSADLLAAKPTNIGFVAFGHRFHPETPCLKAESSRDYWYSKYRGVDQEAVACHGFLTIGVKKLAQSILISFEMEAVGAVIAQREYLDALISGAPAPKPVSKLKL